MTHSLEGCCSIQLSYGRLLVGVEGFEPPTSCSQSRRATRLRYTPNETIITNERKKTTLCPYSLFKQALLQSSFDVRLFVMIIDKVENSSLILEALNNGTRRIANQRDGQWVVDTEAKEAILAFFKTQEMIHTASQPYRYFDKVPLKYSHMSEAAIAALGVRIAPGAIVRYAAHIEPNTVLMPCFINIGAYVGGHSMIDAQCTIGSCAQIGSHVHVGGGTGIGGVLEPLQANPTIIEDDCFIGARCEIAEGMIIGQGSVIGMGTKIGQSTKIYDRESDTFLDHIPPESVVVPGSVPSSVGNCHLNAAIIVKKVTKQTRQKTAINEILHQL